MLINSHGGYLYDVNLINVKLINIFPSFKNKCRRLLCLCNKCIESTTDQECICYFELEKLNKLLSNSNKKTCISELSSISTIILDEEVNHRSNREIGCGCNMW